MIKSKSDIVDCAYEQLDGAVNKKTMKPVVDAVFDVISKSLAAGESVTIPGFGTFSVKESAARVGRNPHTGEAMEVPAGKRVSFKPGATLKAAVKG